MMHRSFLLLYSLISFARCSDFYRAVHDASNPVFSCDNTTTNNAYIYCYGPILEAVNYWQIYNDSKTFVDSPMFNPPAVTMAQFLQEFPGTVETIDKQKLTDWMGTHFSLPGSELIVCTPSDYQEKPSKIMKIVDPNLRQWALSLNNIWHRLCRQLDPKILDQIDQYSIIYVNNSFIIPGGRFREFYYWDAYWIIKGLLVSEMYTTVKSMIMNLAQMVDRFGFVPNGGRVYYTKRSQPPLLSGMVYEYFEATQDLAFVTTILPTLEKELAFWNNNRQVQVTAGNGKTYTVFQYLSSANQPRAEAYEEDYLNGQNLSNPTQFWQDIASTAESGWDFSSRWFADKATFTKIETTKIVPVDLNSFICWNYGILDYLFDKTGNSQKSGMYRDLQSSFKTILNNVFFNNDDGAWYDFNLRTGTHNKGFYPSVAVPLFTGCYNVLDQLKAEQVVSYMDKQQAFNYPSGVPTSTLKNANQQWDFPNGWSPLNHMIIEGLRKSQNPQMQEQAFQIAKKWVQGNYDVWVQTSFMWEKYDVIGIIPEPGFGGEYNVQDGFGWTNGVILDLLYTYSDRMTVVDNFIVNTTTAAATTTTSSTNQIVFFLPLVSSLFIFFYCK